MKQLFAVLILVGGILALWPSIKNEKPKDREKILIQISKETSLNKVETPLETRSAIAETENAIAELPSIGEIETDYQTYPEEILRKYLKTFEIQFSDKNWIARANSGNLSLKDRQEMVWEMRRITAIKKLLIEKRMQNLARNYL